MGGHVDFSFFFGGGGGGLGGYGYDSCFVFLLFFCLTRHDFFFLGT